MTGVAVFPFLLAMMASFANAQDGGWSFSLVGGETLSDAEMLRMSLDTLFVRHHLVERPITVGDISVIYRRVGEGKVSVGLLSGVTFGGAAGFITSELLRKRTSSTEEESRSLVGPLVGVALGGALLARWWENRPASKPMSFSGFRIVRSLLFFASSSRRSLQTLLLL